MISWWFTHTAIHTSWLLVVPCIFSSANGIHLSQGELDSSLEVVFFARKEWRQWECVCLWMWERQNACVCVNVCERERERKEWADLARVNVRGLKSRVPRTARPPPIPTNSFIPQHQAQLSRQSTSQQIFFFTCKCCLHRSKTETMPVFHLYLQTPLHFSNYSCIPTQQVFRLQLTNLANRSTTKQATCQILRSPKTGDETESLVMLQTFEWEHGQRTADNQDL